jgi:hypothetical protein
MSQRDSGWIQLFVETNQGAIDVHVQAFRPAGGVWAPIGRRRRIPKENTLKRSPALTSLSRDHHHALDVARRLRRAGPADYEAARACLLDFWEPRGRRHFEIEERVLLTAIDGSDAEWQTAAGRVLEEHDRIRRQVASLHDVDDARALGELLHDHVRFEERQLFVMLEARLSDDALARLGAAIEREENE